MNNKQIKKVIEVAYGDGRAFYKLSDSWSRYTLRKWGCPCSCGTVSLTAHKMKIQHPTSG